MKNNIELWLDKLEKARIENTDWKIEINSPTLFSYRHKKYGYYDRWGVYTGAIQHVSKRNVFAMLEWLHEQQAKPRKDVFNPKEVSYDQNRSYNVGL